jgi:hypothetical protein
MAGYVPDWPASVDRAVTLVGLAMIIVGLVILLGRVRRRRLRLERAAALSAVTVEAPEPPLPLPIVPNEREKVALVAIRDFLAKRVDPYMRQLLKIAPWAEFARKSKRAQAFVDLMFIRDDLMPLATDLASLTARYRRECEALALPLRALSSSLEALALPIENLYRPVRKAYWFKLIIWGVPLDSFTGQGEALERKIRELDDCLLGFRAQLAPMLECLPEAENDREGK